MLPKKKYGCYKGLKELACLDYNACNIMASMVEIVWFSIIVKNNRTLLTTGCLAIPTISQGILRDIDEVSQQEG